MKKIAYTLFAAILVIGAISSALAQTEQTRDVKGFNAISSSGSFNVHVKIDGTESLKLTANADVINDIQTVVEDGKLKIGFKNSHGWHWEGGTVEVYITAKSLSELSMSGSGSLKVDGQLTGENVKLSMAGSGKMTATAKAESTHVSMAGSGTINLSETTKNIDVSMAGSGDIHLDGNAEDANFRMGGSGTVSGKKFKTETVSIHMAGSGNVYVNVDKELSAVVAGSGNIYYSGTPGVTQIKTSGSGRITKTNNLL